MQSKPYNIVLLPSEGLLGKALRLSKDLEKLGTHFTLDNHNVFPHISVYMTQLNEDGLEKAKNILSEIARNTVVIKLNTNNYNYENTYIDVGYAKNKEIVDLQNKVVEKLVLTLLSTAGSMLGICTLRILPSQDLRVIIRK